MKIKFLLLIQLLSFGVYFNTCGQAISCPPNIDFELGNYGSWQFYTGACCPISTPTAGQVINRHTLTNGIATDPYGGFPIVSPSGGLYSLQLGNGSAGSQAERATYTVHVPATLSNFSLIYHYAMVLENPSHAPADQPRFEVKAYDSATNLPIACSDYSYVSSSTLPGFIQSPLSSSVWYRSWSIGSLNLSGLAGQTIIVSFATGDCGLGAHFGYGYIDMNCSLFQIQSVLCGSQPTLNLNAPPGFMNYNWYDSTYSILMGTTQNLTIATPPANTVFHLELIPYPGYGCTDTLSSTLIIASATSSTQNIVICPPNAYLGHTTSGTFVDTLLNFYGCDSVVTLNLTVLPYITSTINQSICAPASYAGYSATGTYIDTLQTAGGCDSIRTLNLTVNQKTFSSFSNTICQGDTFLNYTATGIYLDTFINSVNCDSIRTVNLTVVTPKSIFAITTATPVPDTYCLVDSVKVDGFLSTPVGLLFTWYWGDGSSTTGMQSSHLYTAPGLYTISLTVTGNLGCKDSSSRTIEILAPNYGTFRVSDNDVCVGDPIYFNDSLGNASSFNWNFGDGKIATDIHNPVHTYDEPGNPYNITLTTTNPVCGVTTYSTTVIVNDYPEVNLGEDLEICPGLTLPVTLTNLLNASALYEWSTGEKTTSITVTQPGYYWVRASNGECQTIDSIWIKRDCYINIPNSFSPNGDGLNDYFFPREILSSGVKTFTMSIFNRWGEKLFYTAAIDGRGWDGKYNGVIQPLGVYVYMMDVEFKNNIKKTFTGNVTLVR